jgi:Flp pilus assembly protein TadD
VSTHGSPRRTIVLTLSETALHLFKHSLVRLGQSCTALAVSSEAAVTAKATARGKPASTVPHVKYLLKRAQSVAALYNSSASELQGQSSASTAEKREQSVQQARDSQLVADNPVDDVQAWAGLATALQLSGADSASVVDAYLNAVGSSRKLPLEQVKAEQTVALDVFVQAAKLLLLGGRFNQARTMLLYACAVYSSATLFMLLGVCYLRLDALEDAEAALVEANLLDNRHAAVWAYLSLVCLASGPHRLVEADKSVEQALRLGLEDAQVLKELATSFMSVDKLQTAEDLIRRALRREAVESGSSSSSSSSGGGGGGSKYTSNARTRRLLADILAGQNQAVKAVEEYQRIIADEGAELKVKLGAAERCSALLTSLGREEELATLQSITAALSSMDIAGSGNSNSNNASVAQPVMM